MMFQTPGNKEFEIPDEWWNFAEMSNWSRGEYPHYPPQPDQSSHKIPIGLIEPPVRDLGVDLFRKYKMVPILFALQSPECALPPIRLGKLCGDNPYRYRVKNGLHRYYVSVAVMYPEVPAITE